MSSPREVIARALHKADVEPHRFDRYWNVRAWDGLSDPARQYWLRLADAVIDALERMEVTPTMCDAAWEVPAYRFRDITTQKIWRAMVGAMRDE